MNDGVHLPEIASTRFLKMNGNARKHQSSSLCEGGKMAVSNRTKNTTSLYTLHCFFKLASQELTPCYRKQAAVRQAEIDLNKHRKKVVDKNRPDVAGQNKTIAAKRKVDSLQKSKKQQRGRERTTSMLESTSSKTKNTATNNNNKAGLKRRETADPRIAQK